MSTDTDARQEPTIRPGDRVVLSEEGHRMGLHGSCDTPCHATVVRWARDGSLVVVREGLVTEEKWHPDFWLATPTEATDDE